MGSHEGTADAQGFMDIRSLSFCQSLDRRVARFRFRRLSLVLAALLGTALAWQNPFLPMSLFLSSPPASSQSASLLSCPFYVILSLSLCFLSSERFLPSLLFVMNLRVNRSKGFIKTLVTKQQRRIS